MATIIKTHGIVLKTTPFKESSLITSLLTETYGKIKVLAKGVRRPKSKLCGALEIFSLDEIIFYRRETKELYTLSDAVIVDNFEGVRSYAGKVHAAMVLCEFYDKTLPLEERDADSYALLLQFLQNLNDHDEPAAQSVMIEYLLKALSGAGVKPHIADCVRCHAPISVDVHKVDFSVAAGGLVCNKHFDDTVIFLRPETVIAMRELFNSGDARINDNIVREIKDFVPDYVYYHLNNLVLHSLKHLH
jgi:DNA repair protein RecO (recombination protein O)